MPRPVYVLAALALLASACDRVAHPVTTAEAAIGLAAPGFDHWDPAHDALQAKNLGRWWLVTSGDPEAAGAGTTVDSQTGRLGSYQRAVIRETIRTKP